MDILLDTHALLWWLNGSDRLGRRRQQSLQTQSILSGERGQRMGNGDQGQHRQAGCALGMDTWLPAELAANRFQPLPVTIAHALAVMTLPRHHSDPFDRVLIAQATVEGLTIITGDAQFARYGISLVHA